MQRLLGEVEIAEEADERREHAARLGAVDALDRLAGARDVLASSTRRSAAQENSMIGRTSMLPVFAEGILAAIWIASFRSFASSR